jgi:outer membrane usher protein
MMGYDGQVYLENLAADNRISVVTPEGGICEIRFTWPAQAEGIPALGPFVCRLESP